MALKLYAHISAASERSPTKPQNHVSVNLLAPYTSRIVIVEAYLDVTDSVPIRRPIRRINFQRAAQLTSAGGVAPVISRQNRLGSTQRPVCVIAPTEEIPTIPEGLTAGIPAS